LEKVEGGEATAFRLCKHCGCMLKTEFTQATQFWPACTADQEQKINFLWLMKDRRRCLLVRR